MLPPLKRAGELTTQRDSVSKGRGRTRSWAWGQGWDAGPHGQSKEPAQKAPHGLLSVFVRHLDGPRPLGDGPKSSSSKTRYRYSACHLYLSSLAYLHPITPRLCWGGTFQQAVLPPPQQAEQCQVWGREELRHPCVSRPCCLRNRAR